MDDTPYRLPRTTYRMLWTTPGPRELYDKVEWDDGLVNFGCDTDRLPETLLFAETADQAKMEAARRWEAKPHGTLPVGYFIMDADDNQVHSYWSQEPWFPDEAADNCTDDRQALSAGSLP